MHIPQQSAAGGYFGPSALDVPSLFQPLPDSVPMYDPLLKRFGTLWLKRHQVVPTACLTRPPEGGGRGLPLCLNYMQDDCQASNSCPNLHVDRNLHTAIRSTLSNLFHSDCCCFHGDVPSTRRDFQSAIRHVGLLITNGPLGDVEVPPERCAVTAFWRSLLESHSDLAAGGMIRCHVDRICRLHQRNACKFAMNCNNLHVCRQLWAAATAGRHASDRRPPVAHQPAHNGAVIPSSITKAPSGRSERSVGDPLPTSSSDLTVRHPREGPSRVPKPPRSLVVHAQWAAVPPHPPATTSFNGPPFDPSTPSFGPFFTPTHPSIHTSFGHSSKSISPEPAVHGSGLIFAENDGDHSASVDRPAVVDGGNKSSRPGRSSVNPPLPAEAGLAADEEGIGTGEDVQFREELATLLKALGF